MSLALSPLRAPEAAAPPAPGTDAAAGSRRRRLDQRRLRQVREQLTSSSGLSRSFDRELLRQFATQRVNAAGVFLIFTLAVAGISTLFLPLPQAVSWLLLATIGHALALAVVRRFRAREGGDERINAWRRRFAASEALNSVVWALLVVTLVQNDAPGARAFTVFAVLLYSAMTAMMAAPVPLAVHAGLGPVALTLVALLRPDSSADALVMAVMPTGALIYFLLLASRLYQGTVAGLEFRTERSALVAELEEAKANSDEARRRAEDANLAKSRFLATMSHELRTPLNAILGFSEVMKGEMLGPFGVPAYRDYARDVHASGQHLLELINEILDLSRIEAGRYELNEEPVSLAGIAQECRHMLALRAKGRAIEVHEALEPDLPRIWADERAVRQIVLNLLSNAIKFTPRGGRINIKVGWTRTGGQYVTVSDNGPGIPEDEMPIVMSSFGRGALAIKTAEQGSGLGLPIVKGLADMLGARFALVSTVRVGTDARVTFPRERVLEAGDPRLAPVQPPLPAATPEPQRNAA